MNLMVASLLGLSFGVKHALEADHLAAVCTFVSQGGSVLRAAKTGALWGAGHALVIMLAGGALVATGASVPAPLEMALDLAVAVMLIGLGVAAFLTRRPQGEAAVAAPGGEPRVRRPLAVGLVHGASGTAAMTLLVATKFPGRPEGLAFVASSGIASLVAMAGVAGLVAWTLRSLVRRGPDYLRLLQGVAGAASIAAGLMVAWSTLVPDGS